MCTISSARARRGVAVVLAAATMAGCATNPVTGRSELSLISESQEVQMGQQAAQDVARSIGLVNDEALQQYVQRIGGALAKDSERPQLPWTFRVVDDPTPNAFALPGGYIFVTRGMMNLMSSEAELASVLGHEIGHVTAKHSVSQMSRQQLAQLGLGIGMILSEDLARYGQLAGAGLQLLFLKYGRDDERQADDLGFKYALNTGYDVREMDDVFQSLQRVSAKEGQSPLPSWLATHPYPEERIQATQARLAALDRPLTGAKTAEAEYLQRLDGLIYGENPRNGFFSGTSFLHPDLRFKVDFPSGWQAQNTPQAVVAVSPQQDAVIQLTLAGTGSPADAARQFLSQQGVQPGQATQETINGLPAVASYFQAQTEQGVIRGLAVFLSHGGRTYQVMAFTPA
ncbi:MAG TPA: M48 family metallopeptidase, partial [Gemmatimonadaceae bacterium]|nr:M48 family metallopeptidase [Gemmatimonadaceae bacterium]